MISYKNWKQLNESMGHTTPLGIRKPQTIGDLMSRWDEMGMMPMKSKKMSMGGMSMGSSMMDDEEGDMPPMPLKKGKKGKKPLPPPPAEEDDLDALAGDEEDIEDDEEALAGDEEDLDVDDEELDDEDLEDDEEDLEGDEEDLEGDEEDLEGDEEDLDADLEDPSLAGDMGGDDEMGGMPMPPMPMPKKKNKGIDGAAMMLKGASRMVKGMKEGKECDKNCDCKKCRMSKKKMKEDSDFLASLKSQAGMTFFDINDDGTFKEDAVFTPYDQNAGLVDDDEPQAGEVGYAPQQRVGGGLGNMAEWTKKHRRKINEAIKAKEAPRKSKGKARKAR